MEIKNLDFLKNKKEFIKSPLGIIAMFISLFDVSLVKDKNDSKKASK